MGYAAVDWYVFPSTGGGIEASISGGTVSEMYQNKIYCEEPETGANCVHIGSVTKRELIEEGGEYWGSGCW